MKDPYQHLTTTTDLIVGDREFRLHSMTGHPEHVHGYVGQLRQVTFEFLLGGYNLTERAALIHDAPSLIVRATTGEAVLDYHLTKPTRLLESTVCLHEVPLHFEQGHSVCCISRETHQVWGVWELESVSA